MTGGALCSCPHCGGLLIVQAATVSVDVRDAVLSCTSTSTSTCTSTRKVQDSTAAPLEQPPLPLPPTLAKPRPARPSTSTWKRAIAIAFKVLEAHADATDQTEAFKRTCTAQGINYAEPGTTDPRPLYARALDYADAQRRRRAVGR